MTKADKLNLLMLLSAIESWSFADRHSMPDYLYERLDVAIELMKTEVLEVHADGEEVLEAIRSHLAEPEKADEEQLARIAKLVDEVDPYPEAEPVAWMMVNSEHDLKRSLHFEPQQWHITWEAVPLYLHPPDPAVRLSAADILALKPDNEAIIDDQWLVRFAINIELDVLERNGL